MNEMQFSRTVYKINLYGESFEMRKPTVKEAVAFQKQVALCEKDDDKLARLTDFFVGLGLDRKAADNMQLDHMVQLSETLSAIDKKK